MPPNSLSKDAIDLSNSSSDFRVVSLGLGRSVEALETSFEVIGRLLCGSRRSVGGSGKSGGSSGRSVGGSERLHGDLERLIRASEMSFWSSRMLLGA